MLIAAYALGSIVTLLTVFFGYHIGRNETRDARRHQGRV